MLVLFLKNCKINNYKFGIGQPILMEDEKATKLIEMGVVKEILENSVVVSDGSGDTIETIEIE